MSTICLCSIVGTENEQSTFSYVNTEFYDEAFSAPLHCVLTLVFSRKLT